MFIPPSYLDYDPPDGEPNKLQHKIRTLNLEQLVKLLYHGKDIHKLYAVQEICRRSYDNAHHNSIYEEGGITGLVDLLAANSANDDSSVPDNFRDELEIAIWKALTNLSVGELTREDIREVGAFPFAMVALQKANRKLQMIVAKFMANMANNEQNREAIRNLNGIQLLLHLLAEVTGIGREDDQARENVDEAFLIAILQALLNISNSHDVQSVFRTADGIRPLLLLLIEYNNNGQEVSLHTLYILNNIAKDNENRQDIVANKGLAIIGSILELNTYVDVLSQAVMLLTTMSLNDDIAESVVSEGLGTAVASLLQQEFYEQTELLQEALKLIVILSKTESQQRALQEAGCLDNLTALLDHTGDSIKSRALIAIVGLLQSSDKGREEFVHRYDGLKRLQKILSESKDDRVLENTIRTLSLLALTTSLKPLLVSEKIGLKLIQVLKDTEKETLEEEIVNFIINMIQNAPYQISMEVLFQSLASTNEMIIMSSLTGLTTLLQTGEISELRGHDDRLRIIRSLAHSENEAIKSYAQEILHLAEHPAGKHAASAVDTTHSRTSHPTPVARSINFASYAGTLVFPLSALWSNALSGAKAETVQSMRLIAELAKVQLDSAQLISETITNDRTRLELQQSCTKLEQLLKDLVVTTKRVLVDAEDSSAKNAFADCIESTLRESQTIFETVTQKLNPSASQAVPTPTLQPAAEEHHKPAPPLVKVATAPPPRPPKFPFNELMTLLQSNDVKGFASKIKLGAKDWLDLAEYAKEAAENVRDSDERSNYFGMADDVKQYLNEMIAELKIILSGGPESEGAKSQAAVLITGLDITLTQLAELVYGPDIPDTPVFDAVSVPVPQFQSDQPSVPMPSFEPKKEPPKPHHAASASHPTAAPVQPVAPAPVVATPPKAVEPAPKPAPVSQPAPVVTLPEEPKPATAQPKPEEEKQASSTKAALKTESTPHKADHKPTQELTSSKTWPGFSEAAKETPKSHDSPKSLWLKCNLKGDVKMMKVTAEIGFDKLLESIKQKFGPSLPAEFEIQYKDSSSDLITIHTDDELSFAFEDFQGTNAPKMEISIEEKVQAPSAPAPPPIPIAPPPPAPPPLDLSILEGHILKMTNNNNNETTEKKPAKSAMPNKADLIAELSQGVQLRKAEVTERKPAKPSTPHEQLLAEIRSGIKLTKVKQEETRKVVRKYETHTSTLGQALASAMMNRRANINTEEEEESDDLSWLE